LEKIAKNGNVYFMGIAGTGMAAVAGLMQEAGYTVSGSDNEVYPPMSTMLDELGIKYSTPYSKENLTNKEVDLVVVANVLSKGHIEVEEMLRLGMAYTSFPALLGKYFLDTRKSLVIAGTHGKTTTTAIVTYLLQELGEDPSYMIGGIPRNLGRSFHLGKGSAFVIEGDEYDTAYFDKESKFLHYRPTHVVFNNLEFDHADIFKDLEAIEKMFEKLLDLVPVPARIIANIDDPGVARVLKAKNIHDLVTRVSPRGGDKSAAVWCGEPTVASTKQGTRRWKFEVTSEVFGNLKIDTALVGIYNVANIAQAIGCLGSMVRAGNLKADISTRAIEGAITRFTGVQRRFDHLGSIRDIDIYEDFAHHPTAVGLVIEAFRKGNPNRRLVVAFEPRNATARRNVFQAAYAKTLATADEVLIGKCGVDLRIKKEERMDIESIGRAIGKKAKVFPENQDLLEHLMGTLKSGDAVIFMSSGSFSGIQYKLLDQLAQM
jgi:UDP-N-acetylmuramate: L-alanyl-gamma-D-glutamyl-meso-diaminopimelate ligase